MRTAKNVLSISMGLLMAGGAYAARTGMVPNRVIVKTSTSASQVVNNLNKLSTAAGVINAGNRLAPGLSVLRFATGVSPQEAANEVALMPGVEWAQPDYLYSIDSQETSSQVAPLTLPTIFNLGPFANKNLNDPLLTADNLWGMFKISAPEAWQLTQGSEKILVADIDTGVDYTHEDLAPNMWKNPDASAPDQHGYDFANKDADPMDDHMHGTHTTGSIGARGDNGKGVTGVSPKVKIIAVKFIAKEGSGSSSDAIMAIDYAVSKGARVLSNSWGGPAEGDDSDKALEEAIVRAGQKDVLFVAAAGNDGSNNDTRPTFPASYTAANILTVASSTTSDNLSFFSNYGATSVDVAAPGSNILSTVPGNKYAKTSGTSMACPHVAGLAALILSVKPTLTALQVKSIIMETVDKIPSMSAKLVSGGRVNALKAVRRAQESGF